MHRKLSQAEVSSAINFMRKEISGLLPGAEICVYGVPRGGIPVAYLLSVAKITITGKPDEADVFVDDIIDTGATKARYNQRWPKVPFLDLASYLDEKKKPGEWLVFPWEEGDGESSEEDIIVRLLQFVGEEPRREGLIETPKRVLKAWKHWTSGYDEDPKDVMKVFKDGGEEYDSMVMVKDLPFYSHCEHHLAPFFGTATIAYIPNGRVLGLSKLGRVLGIYSRRLQIQERLTTLVADCLDEHLQPRGVGVLIRARHLCMESRGICQQGHHTVTSALRGEFMSDHKVRDEFLSLAK